MASSSWREAIIQVLTDAGEPLHYREITERILSQGLYKTDGATPAATVSATLNDSIKKDQNSPFVRVRIGEYMLRESIGEQREQVTKTERKQPVFRAYGMYWDRHKIKWTGRPAIWGKQASLADRVDFSRQIGVYVLYDGHRPIYAGRAIAESLGDRLSKHTKERLAARWTRFSWFGLMEVNKDGSLTPPTAPLDIEQVIIAMEALLIEIMEMPLNMRSGDEIKGAEFFQEEAPELVQEKMLFDLQRLIKSQSS
jgi:hypothetical protein